MIGHLKELTVNRDGTQNIVISVPGDFSRTFDALKDHPVTVEIRKAGKGRSRDANAFCWALCTEIGRALAMDKTDVYRRAIKAVGVYTETQLIAWDVPKVKARWENHGTGWFLEIVDDARGLVGHKVIRLYYGTSTYTVDEMRNVLDWLIDEAEQMQLSIPLSKKEEEELLERWGMK